MSELDANLCCSFCTKPATEVKKLVAGPSVFICDECIDLCHGILHETPEEKRESKKDGKMSSTEGTGMENVPTPREIKLHMDQYIIGQDVAKTAVSVAVYNHYKRLANPIVDDVEIEKSNILLLGPTGCGKTLIAQSIARLLDVPFAIADCTALTEAGYVGDDVESVITKLLQNAEYDVAKAERGIVYLDEIDKKARRGETASGSRDVSGEGVQQSLLKLLEGSEVFVPAAGGRKSAQGEMYKINTRNILFICGGAFVGIDKLVEKSMTKDTAGIGFGANVGKAKAEISEMFARVEPEHVTKYGLIPELVGRLPIIAPLAELTEDQLVHVLTEPKNAVTKQFEKLFQLDGIELTFTTDALKAVAGLARKRKTGARGLRGVIEKNLTKVQFDLPDLAKDGVTGVVVNEDVFSLGLPPMFIRAEKPAKTPPKAADE
ncbi:MAG: ATP-dependent Clp protease ATP-binding subunit ClpX [Verrucomicrobiaceae bacterium]|nr:MAG: ATP-dependent Clp protease ATP-binding subunit ClpX [Verrucomicrobiaceae bacterium]